jgi:hypothetical protein
MRWCLSLILVGLSVAVATPTTSAQWFGSKKPKTPAPQRVSELIVALKFEKDAHKRADAAEELRQFDLKDFPEIIPVLIEALQNDAATGVRIEAATSLGRLRPISAPAGQALEKAAANDANLRVRLQAKTSLVYYQLSGYHAPKKSEQGPALPGRTDEPPLAGTITTGGDKGWQYGSTAVKMQPASSSNVYRPLPEGPLQNPQVPIVTVPSGPTQGVPQAAPTTIQTSMPPGVQIPAPSQWSPVKDDGPRLVPPS